MAGKLSSHSAQASFLPLLLWAGVIFLLSSMPGSGADFEPPLWYILERKSAHVFEYAVLMLLSFRFVRAMFSVERFSWQVLLAGVFSLAYAATDELHQFFVFGRGAKMTDVVIDGGGILLMASMLFLLQKLSRKKAFLNS
jgi:VanZ family protein